MTIPYFQRREVVLRLAQAAGFASVIDMVYFLPGE